MKYFAIIAALLMSTPALAADMTIEMLNKDSDGNRQVFSEELARVDVGEVVGLARQGFGLEFPRPHHPVRDFPVEPDVGGGVRARLQLRELRQRRGPRHPRRQKQPANIGRRQRQNDADPRGDHLAAVEHHAVHARVGALEVVDLRSQTNGGPELPEYLHGIVWRFRPARDKVEKPTGQS